MITRLEAYRYRCFAAVGVDFGAYNVLAGANGSGKTTLLDIPALLGDMLKQRVCSGAFMETQATWEISPRAHTLGELIHQQRGDDFAFVVEARIPHEVVRELAGAEPTSADEELWPKNLRYELRLQVLNHRELHVVNEYLLLFPDAQRPDHARSGGVLGESGAVAGGGRPRFPGKHWRPVLFRDSRVRSNGQIDGALTRFCEETGPTSGTSDVRVPPTQLGLAALSVDRELFPAGNWFRTFLERQTLVYSPQWKELRRASPPGQPRDLVPSGRNVAWLAHELQENQPDEYRAWVEHVQVALPEVRSIAVKIREEDYHAYFIVTYAGGYQVTSSGLSDGTLRILALTLVPYVVHSPQLIAVEEPENGIHPQAIPVVLQSLESVYDGQVWVSTQSPIVMAQSSLADVLCCRLTPDGSAEVVPGGAHPQLQHGTDGVDLGTLFAVGVLA